MACECVLYGGVINLSKQQTNAIIIGAGIGGISLGMRLQSMGIKTTILEKMSSPGGRGMVRLQDGFTFDMGPTVITVPHFIEELFSLQKGNHGLNAPDFTPEILQEENRIKKGESGGKETSKYIKLIPILPFYRIYFADKSYFDYDGDHENTINQIKNIEPQDVEGYLEFHKAAKAIFDRGFVELGYNYFGDLKSMISIVPELFKLNAVKNLFKFTQKYFKSHKLQQVFSFEPLLVGGNPLNVPAIYAMIHFVEKTWGIHFAMGGTGSLIKGFIQKFEELGGTVQLNHEVVKINIVDKNQNQVKFPIGKRFVKSVETQNGNVIPCDILISNADYSHTYMDLIPQKSRLINSNFKVKMMEQSMSLIVIYFGFTDTPSEPLNLKHHNIILGPRYESLLQDIFARKVLARDFSQYLHIPTLTDSSLAPPGHHAAYTLVPVPNLDGNINWDEKGPELVNAVIQFLDSENYIPNLRERIVTQSFIDPNYFKNTLNSYLGNAFGVKPVLSQSAWFRPHNKSEDFENLYLVGASTQPGAGTPSVMMSAKMTARIIGKDLGIL
jgi:phytoene desaturase